MRYFSPFIAPDAATQIQASNAIREGKGYVHHSFEIQPTPRVQTRKLFGSAPGFSYLFILFEKIFKKNSVAAMACSLLGILLSFGSVFWILYLLRNEISRFETLLIAVFWSGSVPFAGETDILALGLLLLSSALTLKEVQQPNLVRAFCLGFSSAGTLLLRHAYIPLVWIFPVFLIAVDYTTSPRAFRQAWFKHLFARKSFHSASLVLVVQIFSIILSRQMISETGAIASYFKPKLMWENLLQHAPYPAFIFGIASLGEKFHTWNWSDRLILGIKWGISVWILGVLFFQGLRSSLSNRFKQLREERVLTTTEKRVLSAFILLSIVLVLVTELNLVFLSLTLEPLEHYGETAVGIERYFIPSHFFLLSLFVLSFTYTDKKFQPGLKLWGLSIFCVFWTCFYTLWFFEEIGKNRSSLKEGGQHFELVKMRDMTGEWSKKLQKKGFEPVVIYASACPTCLQVLLGPVMEGAAFVADYQLPKILKEVPSKTVFITTGSYQGITDPRIEQNLHRLGFTVQETLGSRFPTSFYFKSGSFVR